MYTGNNVLTKKYFDKNVVHFWEITLTSSTFGIVADTATNLIGVDDVTDSLLMETCTVFIRLTTASMVAPLVSSLTR